MKKIKIRLNIKNKILNNTLNNKLNYFKFNNTKKSIYNNNNNDNTAAIYYQSLGKNTFITILFKNKLIFNKSIGHIKINGNNIKKKEKRRTKNLFGFSEYFTRIFFKELAIKYNIKNIKIYYNCLSENVYPLKKHFIYKLYGRILLKNRIYRRVANHFKRKKKEKLKYLKRKERENFKKKNKKFFKYKKKRKKEVKYRHFQYAYYNYWKSKIITDEYMVNIKSINFINKFPYNGCKNKKKKKI